MKMFDALMRAAGGAVDRLAHMRMDAWYNGVTGFGTSRDKTTYGRVVGDTYLTDVELANLYHHSDMAARMVDIVPDQVWRKGCEIRTEDAALDEVIAEKMDNLGLERRMADGMRWGRCFGGGAVLVGADDGQDASKPLNPERASDIKYLYDFDRRYLWPLTYYTTAGHPKLGQPETYLVTNQNAQASSQIVVHESRLILFGGATTGREERLLLNSWDASILQRGHEALRQFDTAWKSVEILLTDAHQSVMKVSGLAEIIAAPGGMEAMQRRGMLTDMYRSVLRAIVVDADSNESLEREGVAFDSIPQTLEKICLRLAASVPMPVMFLMGDSPSGLNATGDGNFRWFYDGLESTQTRDVGPKVRGLVKTWLATKAGRAATKKTPKNITIKWPALWTETPLNEAQRRKVIAETDNLQITGQVFTPDEVALVRGRQEGWDKDVSLSDEAVTARETALTADLAKLGEEETDEPATGQEPRFDAKGKPYVVEEHTPKGIVVHEAPSKKEAHKLGMGLRREGKIAFAYEADSPHRTPADKLATSSSHPAAKASSGGGGGGGGEQDRDELGRFDFSDDQPRADNGQFGEGGGSAAPAGAGAGAKPGAKGKSKPKADKDSRPEADRPKASTEKFDESKATKIGEGANRRVYDAGNEVVKVAKNAAARKDNKVEAEASGRHEMLAKVSEHGPNHEWIKQEKLSPVTHADLAKEYGVSAADQKRTYDVVVKDPWGFDQVHSGKDWLFAATYAANTGKGDGPKSAKKLVDALKGLKAAVPKLDLADLAYPNQWGKSAGGTMKVADYGYTGK